MPYTKTTWSDRSVQYPRRYKDQSDNQYTFTPDEGTVINAGTGVTAERMNNIEQGIFEAHEAIDTHIADTVTTEVHGLRVVDGALQYYDGMGWNAVGNFWDKFTPVSVINGAKVITTGNTYETLYKVTGKGYLSKAIITGDTSNICKIKITVDGVVKFAAQSVSSATSAAGIITSDQLLNGATSDIAKIINFGGNTVASLLTPKTYPYVDDTDRGFCILSQPIFFNTSLLIEVTNTVDGGTVNHSYIGGIEV